MKTLNNFINEALIKKGTKISTWNYFPKDKNELRKIIEQLLKERGENANLNDIDVSNIENFAYKSPTGRWKGYWGLFFGLDIANIDISKWNMSKAVNISYMFYGCENFNCDISNWDVHNVRDMGWAFKGCYNFDCDLSKWNISKNIATLCAFNDCDTLESKKLIPNWYKKY